MSISQEQVINEINQFLDLCTSPHERTFTNIVKKAGFNTRQEFVTKILEMSLSYMKSIIDEQREINVKRTMSKISLTTIKSHISPLFPGKPVELTTFEEIESFQAYVELIQRVHIVYLVELIHRFDLTSDDVADIQELKDGFISFKQKMDFIDSGLNITSDKTMAFLIDSLNKISPTVEPYYYWKKDPLELETLHAELLRHELIEPNKNFVESFKLKAVPLEFRTMWKGKNTQLIYLLFKIFESQYHNGEGIHEIIPKLFIDVDGNDFKQYNLQISTSQLTEVFEGKKSLSSHLRKVHLTLENAGIIVS